MLMRECFDKHGCDKGVRHGYERAYEPIFEPLRHEPIRILEVGIWRGASLCAWLDYFTKAEIVAIDTFGRIQPEDIQVLCDPRIDWYRHDSTVPIDLGHFDITIDDGFHRFPAQRMTLENFKPRSDRYFIEDVWSLDCMTDQERKHKWLKHKGYTDAEYREFLAALEPYEVKYHDLRAGYQPDSFIIEVM